MNPILYYEFGKSGYTFVAETEYQAVLDKAVLLGYTLPKQKEMYYQNEMVKALKTAGLWSKLDQLHIWYHSAGIPFSTINFIHPSFVLTHNSGLTHSFINKEGYNFTGIGTHFTGNYNSQTESGNYQLGNASCGWAYGSPVSIDGGASVIKSNGNNQFWSRDFADSLSGRQYFQQGEGYNANILTDPPSLTNAIRITTRTATNNKILVNGTKYRDSAIDYDGTSAPSPSIDVNYTFDFGYKTFAVSIVMRMAFTGGLLTESECITMTTIWNNYIANA